MATLKDIIENKKREIGLDKKQESIEKLKEKIGILLPTRDFSGSLSKSGINIIAETKIKSPTNLQRINDKSMRDLAKYYEKSNVVAISVLTDKNYFGGDKAIMQKIKEDTSKPILQKDFIIDEYQIYQARAYGADAILLISSILSKDKIKKFIELSRELEMECLVEFNNEKDLNNIPDTAKIYGRNYRIINYDTDFKKANIHQDIYKSPDYIEKIPANAIKVAESRIMRKEDVNYLKRKGFNAFLVGTAFALSKNIKMTIEEFTNANSFSKKGFT
ncbi:MAG: indole-3-glycerol phosphate synthase [bacterium (Candidatus Ratteibacteria) CG_4_10_14_3_um_filter_41_18]|uniref:indole-3-glycerol-phosphate synthase n=4 Tax=Candidatus Ratteibacteria TaxID=2979319 RepID=A0A2M7E8S9_9BACT|nr:MAG: indole-3-glycerol phosphate synthase [bacterium (Candidatus Ratteibacteria) CG01_land_8_20_14_3_00_40_19]PIW33147.1 MAG: indole-3-glycerol phosphate synthase [bacterium (Candidatus Ratteibacteria) CG15_BIG_FIL_POST_REV_8_21_14_020_41_12]PIX77105.1 MAG: indole-3-glycerol phosphate synthase [bacterium (Candidatus Ratteibacteria) CG_4_10_14_3_um_filter_41_18]PJA61176.1 MAG: indole-3-glycerol phosphate synthase [bacterium (Candidatus Ratteibacteria) CG_4_9_14_3_um_filter_41_21]HCG76992.1 in